MDRKKQRGQRRKIKVLFRMIDEFIPFQKREREYEHFHVPSSPWIELPKTSSKIKTQFIRKWLEKTAEFVREKPQELSFCKIVAVIDSPHLWNSQIIIFYSEDYYRTFWDRNGKYQKWDYIADEEMSLMKSRNIDIDLNEKGYYETIIEENTEIKSVLWFYGDL